MVSSTASPTGITLYQQMGDPVNAVVVIGTAIAKSRLFGCETVEQGQVLALECMVRGMPPLTLAEKYHLIQGKLSMRADAMLAEFRANPPSILAIAEYVVDRSPVPGEGP